MSAKKDSRKKELSKKLTANEKIWLEKISKDNLEMMEQAAKIFTMELTQDPNYENYFFLNMEHIPSQWTSQVVKIYVLFLRIHLLPA